MNKSNKGVAYLFPVSRAEITAVAHPTSSPHGQAGRLNVNVAPYGYSPGQGPTHPGSGIGLSSHHSQHQSSSHHRGDGNR